jgi:hypothetical protein
MMKDIFLAALYYSGLCVAGLEINLIKMSPLQTADRYTYCHPNYFHEQLFGNLVCM